MKEVKTDKCPFCGGEEMIETIFDSLGRVSIRPLKSVRSVAIFATVCRDCGSVARTYCKDPEKLYPKKERRER